MICIPDYKPGSILECGQGDKYSKVKILTAGKVIILCGLSQGNILHIKDWYILVGHNTVAIHNTTLTANCENCPFYAEKGYDSIDSSCTVNNTICDIEDISSDCNHECHEDISSNKLRRQSKYNRRKSILRGPDDLSVYDAPPSIYRPRGNTVPRLVTEQDTDPCPINVTVPSPVIKKPSKPTWFERILMCGFSIDE
jgi:hypothetical protein